MKDIPSCLTTTAVFSRVCVCAGSHRRVSVCMPQRISAWTAPLNQNGGRKKPRQRAALSLLPLVLARLSNTSFTDSQETDTKREEIDKWIGKMQTRKKRSVKQGEIEKRKYEKGERQRARETESKDESKGRTFRSVMHKILRDASSRPS